eukprot:CAMPEP_0168526770 /NCGR_PEP_ID=MMETSP0405-20121227/12187_1 /TAXON_ID=498012 /ORGANISM="Trichosphaerium sp, Strain Am-I-7 wt" /LENGTH=290 /DNA_ID=CAMNT_0008549719 /DNA_START=52 /DNA_END=921 /DNA_ORIENTATION=-
MDLFDLKAYYYIGAYTTALSEGQKIQSDDEQIRLGRDIILFRCLLMRGDNDAVLNAISEKFPPALQGVRLLAEYAKRQASGEKTTVLEQDLATRLTELSSMLVDEDFRFHVARIYYNMGNFEEAYRQVYNCTGLEGLGLLANIYVAMNRIDLAQEIHKKMLDVDKDETALTQLTLATLAINSNPRAASFIYQDLIDKYEETVFLLNGLAVSHMHQKQWVEADSALQQALELDPKNAETLANTVACYYHMGKPTAEIDAHLAKVVNTSPKHDWCNKLRMVRDSFDKYAQKY